MISDDSPKLVCLAVQGEKAPVAEAEQLLQGLQAGDVEAWLACICVIDCDERVCCTK